MYPTTGMVIAYVVVTALMMASGLLTGMGIDGSPRASKAGIALAVLFVIVLLGAKPILG
ncbi:MAG: hypothetical protein WD992_01300 [Candidatus Levyibacteriota bacterium]